MALSFGAASLTGVKQKQNQERHLAKMDAFPGPAFAVFDVYRGGTAAAYLAHVGEKFREAIGTTQVEEMAHVCREFHAAARNHSHLRAEINAIQAILEDTVRHEKATSPFVVSDELTALRSQLHGQLRDMQACVHDFEQQEAIQGEYMDQFYEIVGEAFPGVIADAFNQIDQELQRVGSPRGDGSTAAVVWVVGYKHELTLYCANVGDSRAVLSRHGRAVSLSVDHKPHDPSERERVAHYNGGVQRYHLPPASDVHVERLRGGGELVVVATDGAWHALSNQEAVDAARQHNDNADAGAHAVVQAARNRGSIDDVTAIVVQFEW